MLALMKLTDQLSDVLMFVRMFHLIAEHQAVKDVYKRQTCGNGGTFHTDERPQRNVKGTLNRAEGAQAADRLACIVSQRQEAEGVTEELKARDQLAWVGGMNSIRSRAEEIILSEMIFV